MGGQVGGYCDVQAREGGRWTKQAVEVMGGGSASLLQAEPMGMAVQDKRKRSRVTPGF